MAFTGGRVEQIPNSSNSVYYGDGPPTAACGITSVAGDMVINTSGSAGQPQAWRCTTAGDPGTWQLLGTDVITITFNVLAGAAAGDYDGSIVVDPTYITKLISVSERHQTLGTNGSAVTLMVTKVASGTAKASGVDCLSAGIDLKAANDTNQAGALSATAASTKFAAGDAVSLVPSGTLTAVDGVTVTCRFVRLAA